MPDRGPFDAGAHLPFRWHTYPKGRGMRRLDQNDVAWWSDAGALVGIELPNLSAGSVGHHGVTLGTPAFFDADTTTERCAILLDGTNDSISIGAAPYTEGYFDFRADEGHLINVTSMSEFNPTGDVTLLIKIAAGDWTPGSTQTLFSRWLPGVNKVMLLRLNGSGRLVYNWSSDGTNEFQVQSSASVEPATGGDSWVAVTHDVDNGSGGNTVRFFKSESFSEPTTMTLINAVTDPSSTTSYFASASAPIRLGSRDANQERLYGRLKTVILRGSISGANIGLTGDMFRIDADAIVSEGATSILLAAPAGLSASATVTGQILKRPIGGAAAFGPEESSTVMLCGIFEATQPSGARFFDSQPASLMGGQAIHATTTSGGALTGRVARAGVGTETTVAETAATASPEVVCLRVDRQGSVVKMWTTSGGESTTAIDPLQGSSQRYADIRIGSSNENTQYANFDFYAGAILRTAISDADRDLITALFEDASDRYDDGDYWTVTTPGIFDGTFYMPGDQVLATGGTNMEFDAVDWARVPAETVVRPADAPPVTTNFGIVEMNGPPSEMEADFFNDPVIYPYRRLDIYNGDGTLWRENCPLVAGSVNIEYDRDERRSGDCIIYLPDAMLGPGGLWYDKVFKFYRGITFSPYHRVPSYANATLVWQIGSFVADRISEDSQSANFKVTFRDLTKRMMLSKLTEAVTFPEGAEIATVIKALAANSGIQDMLVPPTGKQIGKDFTFETDTSRWEAAKKIANDFGYELFFDHRGWLVMRPFVDPLTSPIYLNLVAKRAGLGFDGRRSNVGSYDRSASDERIFNHVVVIGEGTDRTTVIRAEAENTLPNSPTSVARIGRRTMTYTSSFITTQEQAQETANALLGINALEQFSINVGTIVYPWLEVGTTINFEQDEVNDNFPSRYLLTSASIPLGLEAMNLSGSRVTIVGSESIVRTMKFAMGDNLNAEPTDPLKWEADAVTHWWNNEADLSWQLGYNYPYNQHQVKEVYDRGQTIELNVWMAGDVAYALSPKFLTDLGIMVRTFSRTILTEDGTPPTSSVGTPVMYVNLFSEIDETYGDETVEAAFAEQYLLAVDVCHAANPNAKVGLGMSAYSWTGGNYDLTPWIECISASDWVGGQSMFSATGWEAGLESTLRMLRHLSTYSSVGRPLHISHQTIWADPGDSDALVDSANVQFMDGLWAERDTIPNWNWWSFKYEPHMNPALQRPPYLRALDLVRSHGDRAT